MSNKTEWKKYTHLAIYQGSYYTEGDERSRTRPGHGYSDGTTYYDTFYGFTSEQEMLKWVFTEEKSAYGKKTYQIVKCTPMEVSVEVKVSVQE